MVRRLLLAAMLLPALCHAQFILTRVRDSQIMINTNTLDYIGVYVPTNSHSSLRDVMVAVNAALSTGNSNVVSLQAGYAGVTNNISIITNALIPAAIVTANVYTDAGATNRFDAGMNRWLGVGDLEYPADSTLGSRGVLRPQQITWSSGASTTVVAEVYDLAFGGGFPGYNRTTVPYQIGKEPLENSNAVSLVKSLLSESIVPIGSILPTAISNSAYFASFAPGYVMCDGQSLTQLEYPRLYEAIGLTYGTTNAAMSFKVPDLRGFFLRGAGVFDGVTYAPATWQNSYVANNSLTNLDTTLLGSGILSATLATNVFTVTSTGAWSIAAMQTTPAKQIPMSGVWGLKTPDKPYATQPQDYSDTRPRNVSVYYIIRAR